MKRKNDANRRTVYLRPTTLNAIGDASPSKWLNDSVKRYLSIIEHATPTLTEKEWETTFKAIKEWDVPQGRNDPDGLVRVLPFIVSEYDEALAEKVRSLNYAQKIAVLFFADQGHAPV